MIRTIRSGLATFYASVLLAGTAQALPYTDLTIFGDSLADTGNVLSLTTALAPPPFPTYPGAEGRFSNGPAWTEHLATGLGFPTASAPSNLLYAGAPGVIPIGPTGGQNYAFGGARTGLGGAAGPTTGLIGQLIAWNGAPFTTSLTRPADPGALYVVMGGANDLRDARSANPGSTPADDGARTAAAVEVATNVSNVVALLAAAGARHFLVSNVPDLGKTPEAIALGVAAASTDVTLKFDAALDAALLVLDAFFQAALGVDLDIRLLDLLGLNERVYDDAVNNGGAVFGITNVTAPCIGPAAPGLYFFPGATDINCAVSLYSDPLHPSAIAHGIIGAQALAVVPEPGSLALALLAIGLLIGVRRGRSA
jgi:phospholipase/lecithinase/hemolysin